MNEWKECKLVDVVASANTGLDAIRRAPIIEKETGLKCLRIQDISQKKPLSKWGNTQVKPNDFQKYQLRQNDIIMARTCSTGICTFIKNDMNAVFNNGLVRIRANNDRAFPTFLYYLFLSKDFIGHIDGISGGTSVQLNMQVGNLLSYEFILPPVSEQCAIAGMLSSLDDKIDLLHRQNKTLEAMAETLWRKMFVEETDPSLKKGKLGDFITVKGGTTPSTTNPEYWNGNLCWTSPRDLSGSNEVFLHETERKITEKGLTQIGSGLLPVGTVLLSSRAPIGYLAITNVPTAINQGYIAVVCDGLFSNYYLYLWIKVNMDLIIGSANGSTFLEISKSVFKELEIAVPNENDINKFNSIVKPVFEKILANEIKTRTLTILRDTLLPKLMSGEVKMKV